MAIIKPQSQNPVCPHCPSKSTIKKGGRKNRFRVLQVFQCIERLRKFTVASGKNKTYPPGVILETISTYNLGNSISDTQGIVRKRLQVDVPEGTIRAWIRAHKPLTTYTALRNEGSALFDPHEMIRTFFLEHKQVYRFQLHRAKVELLLQNPRASHLAPARNYLDSVGESFPHAMFQSTENRSSKFPTKLWPPITRKENYATRLAAIVLPTAITNRKRHETLHRFMLVNDSATIAVEIPVYLTAEDVAYYRSRGFNLDFESPIITGHIDFLQVRDGYPLLLYKGCNREFDILYIFAIETRLTTARILAHFLSKPRPKEQVANVIFFDDFTRQNEFRQSHVVRAIESGADATE